MMAEPWFDPNLYAWIPGTAIGVAGGILGSLVGVLAPRGKAKGLLKAAWGVVLLASVLVLAAGVIALAAGQPYGVWYGLGLAGLIGTFVFGPLYLMIDRWYAAAEERRIRARDL
jgi:hypothetical protein